MKLGYVILMVPDVAATMAFYERAFGLQRRFLDDTQKYGEMDAGGTRLAFAADELARSMIPVAFARPGPDAPAPPLDLAFVTEDVAAAHSKAVAAGAAEVKPPEKKPWGQTVGYVRDLNGFLVEICTPMP